MRTSIPAPVQFPLPAPLDPNYTVNRKLAEMLAQDKCNQICYTMEDVEYKEFEVVEKP